MKSFTAKKVLSLFVCLVLLVSLLAGCGQQATSQPQTQTSTTEPAAAAQPKQNTAKKTITLRIGCGQPESAPMVQYVDTYFCEEVAKQVAEKTDYQIEWMKGWGGSMVKLGEALEGCESGIVDLAVVVIPLEPAKLKLWNVFYYMPFACYDSTKGIPVLMEMIEKYPQFTNVLDDYNLKFIGVGYSEPYGMFSSYEVKSVDDLKGEKVGAAGANLTWVENSGAATVQSSLPEMYTSIQTGVYKVGIQPAAMAINVQAYEVAPFIVEGFSSLPCDMVVMNKDALAALPQEVQDIIISVGESHTATDPAYVMAAYAAAKEKAIAAGATVHTLTAEEMQEWIDKIPDSVAVFVQELEDMGIPGGEIVQYYYDGLRANGVDVIAK